MTDRAGRLATGRALDATKRRRLRAQRYTPRAASRTSRDAPWNRVGGQAATRTLGDPHHRVARGQRAGKNRS
jgi:hypothetical protein